MDGWSEEELRRLAAEYARRQAAKRVGYQGRLILPGHPKQQAAVDDPARNVACQCTRRAGKSAGWLRKMAEDARDNPGMRQVYVNTTLPECRRIAWRSPTKDGLLDLNDEYNLGAVPNSTRMELLFPNGHVIEIVAADDERSIQKLLGGAYFRVLLDEAQKQRHIQRLIQEVIGPAMMDFGGQIVMVGTPSRDCAGFFYDITGPEAKPGGWSVHKWSALDNPFFGETEKERYANTVAKALIQTGLDIDSPQIQREWFGKWVKEDANFVYDVHKVPDHELFYADARIQKAPVVLQLSNGRALHLEKFPDLPACLADLPVRSNGEPYEWHHVFGSDLGYNPDPFSLVVWSFTFDRPELFELCSWKQKKLIPDAQYETLKYAREQLWPIAMVVDAGGQKGQVTGWAEGWMERYPLPIEEAEKRRKADYQEFMNGDIRNRLIKFRRGGPLYGEMSKIPLVITPGGRAMEDGRRDKDGNRKFPNDCADGGLYGYRRARHYRYVEEDEEPEPDTPEHFEQERNRMREYLIQTAHYDGSYD